ncbi:MAG: transglutaminase domain-containing protein [Chloroflexi bacterium]|nr:transglutaminase domain-containing protein [Chloroflexota bacterium]
MVGILNKPDYVKIFKRFFILIIVVWVLFVLYPNPVHLFVSIRRVFKPEIDVAAVEQFSQTLPDDPNLIEDMVLEKIPYKYDWETQGMPWYYPTVEQVLAKGKGDCKARAIVIASILESKNIPYRINVSLVHVWVDYEGKKDNSIENNTVKFYQEDPESGKKTFSLPRISIKEFFYSTYDGLWSPMPFIRKVLITSGPLLIILTRILIWRMQRNKRQVLPI